MAQEIFKRYEKKYLLHQKQFEALLARLGGEMQADSYGEHTISNIYFDTRDFELVRQSIEKPDYKEKLRLRAYGKVDDTTVVYAELKKKYDGIVYKRRVPMFLGEARKYLYYGIYPGEDSQILREIDYVMRRYELKPRVYVSYNRTAYFGKQDSGLRVTFDRNICCRCHGLDLQYGAYGTQIMGQDQILMEVKIPGAMPMWMSRLFSGLCIYPVSFSKYGTYYKDYLLNPLMEGGRICA